MIFSSAAFFVFFAAVFLVYWRLLKSRRTRMVFLLLSSCFFYMTWNTKLILVVLALIVLDYFLGILIADAKEPRKRRLLLAVSIVANLGMLGFFKYTNFLLQVAGQGARLLGADLAIPHLDIILPIGISFHTFQSMSYTIDVYYGRIAPTRRFIDFATFVAFFPQLVAGPIVRAKDFLPQLNPLPALTLENFAAGCDLFLLGMIKKVFIADRLSLCVDTVFAVPRRFDGLSIWCATIAYAFQIYCDFSGYSDMARGLARIFGFEFLVNFRTPYMSRDISEFWTRWHISLSTWLRDNLFMPLGGYRRHRFRNLFVTMFLGGLWHGANWTFVAWGTYHGLLLMARRLYGRLFPSRQESDGWLSAAADRCFIFCLVCLGWVLFRAQSFGDAMHAFRKMFGLVGGGDRLVSKYAMVLVLAVLVYDVVAYLLERDKLDVRDIALGAPPAARGLVYASTALILLIFSPRDLKPFIYFQF